MTAAQVREIAGPLGPFFVPAEPAETSRICAGLSELVWAGEYDHPELPRSGIRSVVDVGAGWGAFAVWARARYGADVAIDCYDPHARGCEFVAVNDPAARVHRFAVTSSPAAFLCVGEDWGASSTKFNVGRVGDEVPVLHPGSLPAADFLKVDAEGVEAEILAGYSAWGSLRALAYEWHTPELRRECRAIVEARGGLRLLEDRHGPWGPGNGVAVWVPK